MIENFKGKRHTLTREDSVKGGLSRSAGKVLHSRINPVKPGKHARHVKSCDSCMIPCPKYQEGMDCTVYSTKFVQLFMFHKGFSTTGEFDDYMFAFLTEMIKAEQENSTPLLTSVLHKLLEIMEVKNQC